MSIAIITADHMVTDSPIGLPTMRSLANPNGAAHHAGHASGRSSRHATSISKPQSGHHPEDDTIGSSATIDPAMTVAAGTYSAP